MDDKNVNEGVQILIKRMETHPEEFTKGNRWTSLMAKYESILLDTDRILFNEKYNELRRAAFTAEVMKELLMADGEHEIDQAVLPKPSVGAMRYNANTMQAEMYDGHKWLPATIPVGTGGGGGGSYTTLNAYGGGGGGGSKLSAPNSSGMVIISDQTGTHTFSSTGVQSVPKGTP